MKAILYICHGSRVKVSQVEAVNFVEKCKTLRNEPIQEYCFLELAEPTISQAIERCIELGATSIQAIPVLLLTAAHAKHDIPLELDNALSKYPSIELKYGKPIGVHPQLINLLHERILQTMQQIDYNTKILMIGRGSSDLDVKRDLSIIAQRLEGKLNHPVDICFLTGCEPYFHDVIANINTSIVERVLIVPYFLFTGILLNGINRTVNEFSEKLNCRFYICDYLGHSPHVLQALNDRINELIVK
nr:sirohydrochlorin chelatase [Lysinibacillus timonensis]